MCDTLQTSQLSLVFGEELSWRVVSSERFDSLSICCSLRQLDTEFMRRLSHSVNIIPVIAKADTMTMEERQEFKQRVSFTKGSTRNRLNAAHPRDGSDDFNYGSVGKSSMFIILPVVQSFMN